jgi:hypothetical protein
MTANELAKQIVDAAYRIHTTLGPGLLETVYRLTLAWEREKRGLKSHAKAQSTQRPDPLVLLNAQSSRELASLFGSRNARGSVESNDSRVTHSTTPFSP